MAESRDVQNKFHQTGRNTNAWKDLPTWNITPLYATYQVTQQVENRKGSIDPSRRFYCWEQSLWLQQEMSQRRTNNKAGIQHFFRWYLLYPVSRWGGWRDRKGVAFCPLLTSGCMTIIVECKWSEFKTKMIHFCGILSYVFKLIWFRC
jgi:hypothetical protein